MWIFISYIVLAYVCTFVFINLFIDEPQNPDEYTVAGIVFIFAPITCLLFLLFSVVYYVGKFISKSYFKRTLIKKEKL